MSYPRAVDPLRLIALACGVALSCACTYGVRGGVGSTLHTAGPMASEASVTAGAGFGSTANDVSEGFHETVTLAVGAELRHGGVAVAGLGGIEYFRVPELVGRPFGLRAGVEAGVRTYTGEAGRTDVVGQLVGGPLLRLGARDRFDRPLVLLGLDLALGMSASLDDAPAAPIGVVIGLAVDLGFVDVRRFHF